MKKMTIEWPSNQTTHLDLAPSSSMNSDILTASSGVKDRPIVNTSPICLVDKLGIALADHSRGF
ncbi:hypothetical protein PGT21_003586 [Puccinia graminis f. sp. tritici]|uniref:Uncharacterized protein n=1 Tax=Puccinia graminis f. sp. tritici TaxID=56615 RepID=A0A5B0LWL2_PUCGR|nr:hypothetical protein PGT21_003586 [Puccinia graminis f. sp. tritici]